MKRFQGFTLIELMITVAIIGILAAIVYPSYRSHVVKSNRAATQAFMMDIANREKQYLLDARAYTNTLSNLGITTPYPSGVQGKYTVAVTTGTTPPSFTITATPVSGSTQDGDGNLTLTDTGTKSPSNKW